MIEYSASDVQWFNSQVKDMKLVAMAARLDQAIADRKPEPLAVTEMRWQKLQQAKRVTIVEHNLDAEDEQREAMRDEQIDDFWHRPMSVRACAVWLAAVAVFVAGMIWMVQR